MSSKFSQVKKAYKIKVGILETAINTADEVSKQELKVELEKLNGAYQEFADKVVDANKTYFKTVNALQDVGCKPSDDWAEVEKKYEDLPVEEKETISSSYEYLKDNKQVITKRGSLHTTLIGSAAVLAAAGVSLTVFHYLDIEEIDNTLQEVKENPEILQPVTTPEEFIEPEEPIKENEEVPVVEELEEPPIIENEIELPEEGVLSDDFQIDTEIDVDTLLDEETVQSIIEENLVVEEEVLEIVSLNPDPEIALSLQYKLQVFASMVSAI
ncbi:hypothetical protein Y10_24080 [Neptunitalea sp. Y10]|uniref:Uncharacterized protein n=2 Tax=Neptunitalea lumnitzerae TaxID=2965509 RepID=A0ABQ5MKV0_9FLAO|nr:hypothetical protein Y10_24080 [Neptunitalea sp. Y10]